MPPFRRVPSSFQPRKKAMSARGSRVAASSSSVRNNGKKKVIDDVEEEPEQQPLTQQRTSKFLKRAGHGAAVANSALSPKNFDVRLHQCVAQKDMESGLRKGDATGNWMIAISTPIGPPDDRAKWLGVYKTAVDTARLGSKHTFVNTFPLLGSLA